MADNNAERRKRDRTDSGSLATRGAVDSNAVAVALAEQLQAQSKRSRQNEEQPVGHTGHPLDQASLMGLGVRRIGSNFGQPGVMPVNVPSQREREFARLIGGRLGAASGNQLEQLQQSVAMGLPDSRGLGFPVEGRTGLLETQQYRDIAADLGAARRRAELENAQILAAAQQQLQAADMSDRAAIRSVMNTNPSLYIAALNEDERLRAPQRVLAPPPLAAYSSSLSAGIPGSLDTGYSALVQHQQQRQQLLLSQLQSQSGGLSYSSGNLPGLPLRDERVQQMVVSQAAPPPGAARRLPTLLAIPEDALRLSSHQAFLRLQIEVFEATEDDIGTHTRGRNKPITRGQVGIRCRHCAHVPVSLRKKGSTYFPASLSGLYQAAQNQSSTHLQCGLCPEMPDEIKQKFATLLASKAASTGAGRPYWAEAGTKLGLVDTPDGGIRFVRSIAVAAGESSTLSQRMN